jgi:hypothetical protein
VPPSVHRNSICHGFHHSNSSLYWLSLRASSILGKVSQNNIKFSVFWPEKHLQWHCLNNTTRINKVGPRIHQDVANKESKNSSIFTFSQFLFVWFAHQFSWLNLCSRNKTNLSGRKYSSVWNKFGCQLPYREGVLLGFTSTWMPVWTCFQCPWLYVTVYDHKRTVMKPIFSPFSPDLSQKNSRKIQYVLRKIRYDFLRESSQGRACEKRS